MRALAHAHPVLTALAVVYAVCLIGLGYCFRDVGEAPGDPYYP